MGCDRQRDFLSACTGRSDDAKAAHPQRHHATTSPVQSTSQPGSTCAPQNTVPAVDVSQDEELLALLNHGDEQKQQWALWYMHNPAAWLEMKAKSELVKEKQSTDTPAAHTASNTGHCKMTSILLESYKDVLHALSTLLLIPENRFEEQCGNRKALKELYSERIPVVIAPIISFDPTSHSLLRIRGVDFTEDVKQELATLSLGTSRKTPRSRTNSRARVYTSDLTSLLQVPCSRLLRHVNYIYGD